MIQENKELLLKDLSARLPYDVKVKLGDNPNIFNLKYKIKFAVMYGNSDKLEDILDITNIKPYLFPISSMSDKVIDEIYAESGVYDIDVDSPVHIEVGTNFEDLTKIFEVLHKHHIDYRNLIQKGLAIDATDLNIY